ncbi:MAG: HNH endonuclease [Pseudanabaena sp.]
MSRPYISVEIDRNVRSVAKNRCGYCLSPQKLVMARLEIEHIIPVSKGGSSEESNLWLACPICNSHKAGKIEAIDPVTDEVVALFNPRTQVWAACFPSSNTQHIQLSEQIQNHLSNYGY